MTFTLLERRVLAVGTVIVLHAVLVGAAAGVQAYVERSGPVPFLPHAPLLVTAVGLLMAHCSLGAIWWARSTWPSHAKTLVGVLATAVIWVLLVAILETANLAHSSAVAWAASLTIQAAAVGLGAAVINLLRAPGPSAGRRRFTILFLILWTAVVAVLLGAGRKLAETFGWKLTEVLAWEHLYKLLAVGVANAVLAISVLAVLQMRRSSSVRIRLAVCTLMLVALVIPILMAIVFQNVGPSPADLVWLLSPKVCFCW